MSNSRVSTQAGVQPAWLIERKVTRWDKDLAPRWWWGWGHPFSLDDMIGWTTNANMATKFADEVSAQNALWTLMTMAGVPRRGEDRERYLERVAITEHEWT